MSIRYARLKKEATARQGRAQATGPARRLPPGRRMNQRVYVVGTADTKGDELAYLADALAAGGAEAVRVDVGTRTPTIAVDIAASDVAGHHPQGASAVLGGNDRGAAVAAMTEAFARFVETRGDISGII